MGKPNFQRVVISRVTNAAPDLRYIAYYKAEENYINACMHGYENRSFVYILTVNYKDTEHFLYVGKSRTQYARFISHLGHYDFDYIYLFECEPEQLSKCETAIIRELRPLLNIDHNPDAKHNKQFLGIQNGQPQNQKTIRTYLQRRERYAPVGLYGFSLSPVLFSVLESKAHASGYTCSEFVQKMLESAFPEDIAHELAQPPKEILSSNLISVKDFGAIHGRSQEQTKQHLHNSRLPGLKIGRDWVLPNDSRFPVDLRRKIPK